MVIKPNSQSKYVTAGSSECQRLCRKPDPYRMMEIRAHQAALRLSQAEAQHVKSVKRLEREAATLQRERERDGYWFKVRAKNWGEASRAGLKAQASRRAIRTSSTKGHMPSYGMVIRNREGLLFPFQRTRYRNAKTSKQGTAREVVRYGADGAYQFEDGLLAFYSSVGLTLEETEEAFDQLERINRTAAANAKVVHHMIIQSLYELTPQEQFAMAIRYCERTFGSQDLPYSVALHPPSEDGDQRNWHVHIVFSYRPMVRTGEAEWQVGRFLRSDLDSPAHWTQMRALLADELNHTCEKEGLSKRYTHLSYAASGLDYIPQSHLGPGLTAKVRRGEEVEKNERNHWIVAHNTAMHFTRQMKAALKATTVKLREAIQDQLDLVSLAAAVAPMPSVSELTKGIALPTVNLGVDDLQQCGELNDNAPSVQAAPISIPAEPSAPVPDAPQTTGTALELIGPEGLPVPLEAAESVKAQRHAIAVDAEIPQALGPEMESRIDPLTTDPAALELPQPLGVVRRRPLMLPTTSFVMTVPIAVPGLELSAGQARQKPTDIVAPADELPQPIQATVRRDTLMVRLKRILANLHHATAMPIALAPSPAVASHRGSLQGMSPEDLPRPLTNAAHHPRHPTGQVQPIDPRLPAKLVGGDQAIVSQLGASADFELPDTPGQARTERPEFSALNSPVSEDRQRRGPGSGRADDGFEGMAARQGAAVETDEDTDRKRREDENAAAALAQRIADAEMRTRLLDILTSGRHLVRKTRSGCTAPPAVQKALDIDEAQIANRPMQKALDLLYFEQQAELATIGAYVIRRPEHLKKKGGRWTIQLDELNRVRSSLADPVEAWSQNPDVERALTAMAALKPGPCDQEELSRRRLHFGRLANAAAAPDDNQAASVLIKQSQPFSSPTFQQPLDPGIE